MTTATKILSLFAVLAIGFGIYTSFGTSGNEPNGQMTQNTAETAKMENAGILAQLKPLAKGNMAAMRILDKPVDLSNISFTDGANKSFTIGDWKDRVVLLNLWATWCPPCRHEMPSLEDLEKRLGSDGFEVVTVSIDLKTPDKPKEFFRSTNLTELDFYWDGTAKIFNKLKSIGLAFGMPTTILIDKNGMALGVVNGPAQWNSDDAIALIKKAL